jgi:hypothetical protein
MIQTAPDDRLAQRNVTVLVAAQAILGGQMPMIFVIGGLAGGMLTANPCFATLPISLIVFSSMTTAPWLSSLMQKYGRKTGFFIGAIAGALGAAVSAYGLYVASFAIFLLGSYISGIYMSAQGFYRFAATDTASDSFRPKAISFVMAGGLISAIFGPQLNKLVQDASVVPVLIFAAAPAQRHLQRAKRARRPHPAQPYAAAARPIDFGRYCLRHGGLFFNEFGDDLDTSCGCWLWFNQRQRQ